MDKIKDIDIRRAYIAKFSSEFGELFINEWALGDSWKGYNVADIVGINNGDIHLYEIKSETDCLKRLEKQIHTYKKLADFVTLIIHKKHLTKALEYDLKGVRIIVAEGTVNGIVFTVFQDGKRNKPDPYFILNNCWKEDVIRLAYHKKLIPKMLGSKYKVMVKLKDNITLNEAKKLLIARLHYSYKKTCIKCGSFFVRNTSSKETNIEDGFRGGKWRVTESLKYQECYICNHKEIFDKKVRRNFIGFKLEDKDKDKDNK